MTENNTPQEANQLTSTESFHLCLVEVLDNNDYDLIIQLGSDTSTLVIARMLARIATKREDRPAQSFYCFDSVQEDFQKTKKLIAQHKINDRVQLDLLLPGQERPKLECFTDFKQQHSATTTPLNILLIAESKIISDATGWLASYFQGAKCELLAKPQE